MSGVGVVCFASCYAIAFVLELAKIVFRKGPNSVVVLVTAGAGFFAHTTYLYYRAVEAVGVPMSSQREWYLVAAWGLAGVYLYLTYYHPTTIFGVLILPLVLGLIGAAAFLADSQDVLTESMLRYWETLHGTAMLLAAVGILFGFVAGLMYLWQARRLKHKLTADNRFRMPSLEWLQRTNSRAIGFSALLLTVGVLSGLVLTRIHHTKSVPWDDPTVLGMFFMLGWLWFSQLVNIIYRPARHGRKVACLTVVSFVFLVVALGVGLLAESEHGAKTRQTEQKPNIKVRLQEPETSQNSVPLLRRSSAGGNSKHCLPFRQAVAHRGEKWGLT